MRIYVLGDAVRYEDNDVVFVTAKGNITPIKESNTRVSFKNPITPQKSFEVLDILDAGDDPYGNTADEVIFALSSLVFKTEGGVIPTTPSFAQTLAINRDAAVKAQYNAVDYATVNDLNTIAPSFDRPRKTQEYFYDFIGSTLGTPMGFYTQGGGANASNVVNVGTEIGALSFSTGTTNTGRAGIAVQVFNCLTGGIGTYTIESFVKLEQLSNITQRFYSYSGFSDTITGEPLNGVYFKYDSSLSANWLLTSSINGVRSQVTSSALVTTSYVKLKVVFEPTIATFYVNGVSVGTLNTNLPIGVTRCFSFLPLNMVKNIGNTAALARIDYTNFKIDLTTSR